jgi:acid phosphatase type 7
MADSSPRRVSRRLLIVGAAIALIGLLIWVSPPLRGYILGSESSRRAPDTEVVIAAAGDISCSATPPRAGTAATSVPTQDSGMPSDERPPSRCAARQTADLIKMIKPEAVLALGDLQYECGDESDYANAYNATWGQWTSITRAVIGNHEYGRACGRNDATAYFERFGQDLPPGSRGWYSFDLGGWHLIALNSQCSYGEGDQKVGGCHDGSDQERWLRADLATHTGTCTLAFWHEPRFSSGQHGDAVQMTDLWNVLVDAHVDVVLAGHNHSYERFEPLGRTTNPGRPARKAGVAPKPIFQHPTPDAAGIQQFVVGTGGKNHYQFHQPPMTGEVVRNGTTFGILKLTLRTDSYDWEFMPIKGSTFTDSGSAQCR